jgi:hypothetical protein
VGRRLLLEHRIERLQADGYKVTAPQLPETSLADDVARVRHVLTRQSGPTVLAANSDAERQFAQRMGADTIEVASGHCAMVSHPEETHERILTAANAAAVPG